MSDWFTEEQAEKATMTLLKKADGDLTPGVNWWCSRQWKVNEVRHLMKKALRAIEDPREILAARMLDAYTDSFGKPVPWEKAVDIVATVKGLSDEERQQLLKLR